MVDGRYVLAVEDEPDGQHLLMALLEQIGVKSKAVGSAEESVNLLQEEDFDAVIIDLALPGVDGLALLRRIKTDPSFNNLPCMVVTAYHDSAVKQQAIEGGADAYMPKPINPEAFLENIKQLLS